MNTNMKDQQKIVNALQNKRIRSFVHENLRKSLPGLGSGQELIDDLLNNLQKLDVKGFGERHREELDQIFTIRFLQQLAPIYFNQYVIPQIKPCRKIIDIGCGTGILAKQLSQTGKFDEVVGIEIIRYPEWDKFSNAKTRFEIIQEAELEGFLQRELPDSIVMTWVLHHMEFDQQIRYMKRVYDILKPKAQVVILEDAYSTQLPPHIGKELHEKFMQFTPQERQAITGVNDWTANRVLGQRGKVPVPFGYRTVEEWIDVFTEIGYKNAYNTYIGFPDRDVYNPQSSMVFEK